jgi:hypothetical protein
MRLRKPKAHYGYLEDGVAFCGRPIRRVLADDERSMYRVCRECARLDAMRVAGLALTRYVRLTVSMRQTSNSYWTARGEHGKADK